MKKLLDYFQIEKQPRRGLLAMEWAILAYLAFTLLFMLFVYTRLANPDAMIWGRVRVVATMVALWAVYRIVPCRVTMLARVAVQMALLAWWYPDTYELNRVLPNLDHVFATWEQQLFGFQPALTFARNFPSAVISELMSLGYASYYPMIVFVTLVYYVRRYAEFQRCAFVIMASFMAFYVIFDLVPVVGPTFYYKAIGLHNVANGVFPVVGHYFNSHTDCLTTPGYTDGIFYQMVEDAKAAGERPTAAFPSSHVGISTVCMLLLWHIRSKKMLLCMLPLYIFLCLATVYIQAHYAIDALVGLATGVVFFAVFMAVSRRMNTGKHR